MTVRTIARRVGASAAALAALAVGAACAQGGEAPGERASNPPPPTPAEHAEGERLFAAHCQSCHGAHARGTTVGPPLVHIVYEPSHHADAAFYFAAERGVVQHHWRFGNMPPQPQVGRDEMTRIIGYIRWLQRQAGIE
jgi:cytochrome c2